MEIFVACAALILIIFIWFDARRQKSKYKAVGTLNINKDVNDFYLVKLEFHDEVSTFINEDYILLKVNCDKNLYDE